MIVPAVLMKLSTQITVIAGGSFSMGVGGMLVAQTITDGLLDGVGELVGGSVLLTAGVLAYRMVIKASDLAAQRAGETIEGQRTRISDLEKDLLDERQVRKEEAQAYRDEFRAMEKEIRELIRENARLKAQLGSSS